MAAHKLTVILVALGLVMDTLVVRCVACPSEKAQSAPARDCCQRANPQDHCGMPVDEDSATKPCPGGHQAEWTLSKAPDQSPAPHVAPAIAVSGPAMAEPSVGFRWVVRHALPPPTAPPDLYLLNSAILI